MGLVGRALLELRGAALRLELRLELRCAGGAHGSMGSKTLSGSVVFFGRKTNGWRFGGGQVGGVMDIGGLLGQIDGFPW